MRKLGYRPRAFWIGVGAIVCAAASVAVWGATLSGAAYWVGSYPKYVYVERGCVVVMSTIWRADGSGVRAWESDGWIYDRYGTAFSPWVPGMHRYGQTYGGTPGYVAYIDAVTIPAWMGALPLGLAAWWLFARGARQRAGRCVGCGYSRAGLAAGAKCPECGRSGAQ